MPKFYTCGAEGFWRPTTNPALPLIYPACTAATPAQRVFKIKMNFPTSVLCNEAGQEVLKQKVRQAVNSLNRDWNFCSNSFEGKMKEKIIYSYVRMYWKFLAIINFNFLLLKELGSAEI